MIVVAPLTRLLLDVLADHQVIKQLALYLVLVSNLYGLFLSDKLLLDLLGLLGLVYFSLQALLFLPDPVDFKALLGHVAVVSSFVEPLVNIQHLTVRPEFLTWSELDFVSTVSYSLPLRFLLLLTLTPHLILHFLIGPVSVSLRHFFNRFHDRLVVCLQLFRVLDAVGHIGLCSAPLLRLNSRHSSLLVLPFHLLLEFLFLLLLKYVQRDSNPLVSFFLLLLSDSSLLILFSFSQINHIGANFLASLGLDCDLPG